MTRIQARVPVVQLRGLGALAGTFGLVLVTLASAQDCERLFVSDLVESPHVGLLGSVVYDADSDTLSSTLSTNFFETWDGGNIAESDLTLTLDATIDETGQLIDGTLSLIGGIPKLGLPAGTLLVRARTVDFCLNNPSFANFQFVAEVQESEPVLCFGPDVGVTLYGFPRPEVSKLPLSRWFEQSFTAIQFTCDTLTTLTRTPTVRLEDDGFGAAVVVVESGFAIKGGELGLLFDPTRVFPVRVERGPDFPEGDGLVLIDPDAGGCPDGTAGLTVGWVNSQTGEVLTPPGTHRLVRIVFERRCDGPDGCSPLEFVSCLGPIGAPISNVVTMASDRSASLCTADGEICLRGGCFQRGDTNEDTRFDISDAIKVFTCLFVDSSQCPSCRDALDSNDDGEGDLSDGVYLLNWRFNDGPPPPDPRASCGTDPTEDGLGCDSFSPCEG